MKGLFDETIEVEITLLVHRIFDAQRRLQEVLARYRVRSPAEMKELIATNTLEEHPPYEDYLDAISYQLEIADYFQRLDARLNQIRSRV